MNVPGDDPDSPVGRADRDGRVDLGALRKEYKTRGLDREDLLPDPIDQFAGWFAQAQEAGLTEPNAMSLATADAQGQVSLRTVLLKLFDRQGFVFFTNYNSRKAQDIAANASVALLFPWLDLERQVKIRGRASRVSTAESLRYFSSRPRGSQIGAWVSDQSQVLSSRKVLEMKLLEMKRKFGEGKIPLPDFWGGYRVEPVSIEFWQGRESRLHDRFVYTRQADGSWTIERLMP
jgi:pyridoxamine 5'-phosphate oxidase